MTQDQQKRAAGEAAAALVEAGMAVGLGTGSTAAHFVAALAARRLDIRCVPTSEMTAALARQGGMALTTLEEVRGLDLTVDGADEIGPGLALIKGAGAALLREKLVWEASRRCVVIADAGKRVPSLGCGPLPIEVVAFAHASTAARIADVLAEAGIAAPPVLRLSAGGAPVLTDGGNLIYDVTCGAIPEPRALGGALKALTGVVEHGLFLGLAERALVAGDDGVRTILASDA
ncbi:MAG: ribose-5-phosphate isomerase RpiA [Caulobacteraceae bacterium]|nr:ribose-5-phosphate isomerase RpiA [Caulobacteraceae bacterium]